MTIARGATTKAGPVLLCAALLLLGLAGALAARADTTHSTEVLEVEAVELLSAEVLATLVAPVALYPDDLLAIVLPAATFPVQVVLAARFLEARQANPDLTPDETWDASIVALLNYPEVLALLDENLAWTSDLGAAVLVQEQDVIAAVAAFRQQAKAAGNLKSDDKQTISVAVDDTIEITPVEREVIHVPYYDPQEVTSYQPQRVYHYYPRAYPVYYYPYPSSYFFANGPFWGVTSAFSIGWHSRSLHWHHHGFYDHPYFGYTYYDPFYYRRPHIWLNINYQDRGRRHQRRHHADNRWHGGGWRGDGRRHRRDRHARRDGLDGRPDRNRDRRDRRGRHWNGEDNQNPVHPPRGRGRNESPSDVAGRGIKRTLATPDKPNNRAPKDLNKPPNRPFVHKPARPASIRTEAPGRTMSERTNLRRTSASNPADAARTPTRGTSARRASPRPGRASAGVHKPINNRWRQQKSTGGPRSVQRPQRIPSAVQQSRSHRGIRSQPAQQRPAIVPKPRLSGTTRSNEPRLPAAVRDVSDRSPSSRTSDSEARKPPVERSQVQRQSARSMRRSERRNPQPRPRG